MWIIIICIAVIVIGAFILFCISLAEDDEPSTASNVTPQSRRPTGCASSKACQHMHLGKAKEAGYDTSRITYCRACNDYVPRKDHCENFLSHGCANGICQNGENRPGEGYFCKKYNTIVEVKDSCPYYLDFFDSAMGENLLKSIKKESSQE